MYYNHLPLNKYFFPTRRSSDLRHWKWVDQLEEISHLITDEWMDYKEFILDNGHDKVFLKGDLNMIESICIDGEDDN